MSHSALAGVVFFDLGNTLVFQNASGQLQRYADALDTLEALRVRGYRLGLLSNQVTGTTVGQVRTLLESLGLAAYIESALTTISAEITGNVGKPNRPIFDLALQKAGHPAADARSIFVSEEISHVVAARGYGWRAILKRNTGACQPRDGECVTSLSGLLIVLPELADISCIRSVSGSTTPGSTNWQPYAGNSGIYVDIETTAGNFASTPRYFATLGGNSSHWATTGANSIYNETRTGFRVYVRWLNGSSLTPSQANSFQWHINWWGVEE
jgi:hypothetical protein